MSKYQRLLDWLRSSGEAAVELSLADIEALLGFSLPASARRYEAYWLAGNMLGRQLRDAGWRARPLLSSGRIEFRRLAPTLALGPAEGELVEERGPPARPADLILVGCVKTKLPGRHPAQELYTSALFKGRRRYAASVGVPWFILSANYGLLAPDQVVEAYEKSLLELSAQERRHWAEDILAQLDARYGSVEGRTVEVHAGEEYRSFGLVSGLKRRGARVTVPLKHMLLGQQISWYQSFDIPATSSDGHDSRRTPPEPRQSRSLPGESIAEMLSEDFLRGQLYLSGRPGAPTESSWRALPECIAADRLRLAGASDEEVRTFLTLMAAMDRARNAQRLWSSGATLFEQARWPFVAAVVCQKTLTELRDALAGSGVSQRHSIDAAAWRLISEALTSEASPIAVRQAVGDGEGDAGELLGSVTARTPNGQPWFPLLLGPKVSVMWIRMLAEPGRATISNLSVLPVAVDVQVRKATEYLGVTDTGRLDLDRARAVIQEAWAPLAAAAVGPEPLRGTGAALDPALWFLGKWGCSYCERAGRKLPVSRACAGCRFPNRGTEGP